MAKVWSNEAVMLIRMNEKCNDHILRFITAFTRGDSFENRSYYYLVFEWAEGGSLEDLWKEVTRPHLNPDLMAEAVTQLRGLASAIQVTHVQAWMRHGDLKPENILRFRPTSTAIFGTLKIGDWRLAKYHNVATVLRSLSNMATTTNLGTALYEPPEVEISPRPTV